MNRSVLITTDNAAIYNRVLLEEEESRSIAIVVPLVHILTDWRCMMRLWLSLFISDIHFLFRLEDEILYTQERKNEMGMQGSRFPISRFQVFFSFDFRGTGPLEFIATGCNDFLWMLWNWR